MTDKRSFKREHSKWDSIELYEYELRNALLNGIGSTNSVGLVVVGLKLVEYTEKEFDERKASMHQAHLLRVYELAFS